MLKLIARDYDTLPTEMLEEFKSHLRILDNMEDASIKMYLAGAMDAIALYGDRDIFRGDYIYEEALDNDKSSTSCWRCGRVGIFDVQVVTSQGVDNTNYYTIDYNLGYFSPTIASGDIVSFSAGYLTAADVPPNLKIIVYRYGAHLFENREAINIGEPKHLPDWIPYALASIWTSRV